MSALSLSWCALVDTIHYIDFITYLPLQDLSAPHSVARKPLMTREQRKYCSAIIKQLKRHRDAPAFLYPVDPVLLKIPDYPDVIKHPMDLSTVENKLNNVEYETVDDFVADINLIFSNCYLYNGRELPVSICASNLEKSFQSSMRHMPKEVRKSRQYIYIYIYILAILLDIELIS